MKNEKLDYINVFNINDLIALCHILDKFERFNDKLINLISKEKTIDFIFKLEKLSYGKFCLANKRIK